MIIGGSVQVGRTFALGTVYGVLTLTNRRASRRPDSYAKHLRWIGIVMAEIEIAIHAKLAPDHLREIPYIGALFLSSVVLLAGVAVALLFRRSVPAAWTVGALVCAGMFVGFLLSRSIGFPDYHEAWTSDGNLGLISLPPELIFIAAAVETWRTSPRSRGIGVRSGAVSPAQS